MHFLRLPSKCGRCGLPFWQRPQASSARLPFATHRSQDCFSPAIRKWQGWTKPKPSRSSRHDSPALRPAVAKSSARYRKVRGGRLPSRVRPHRCRNQRHGARCRWRCISPPASVFSAAWHFGRGVPRPGRVSPTDAKVAPRRVRLPGLRVSPLIVAALRPTPNCFDAPRTCPGLPGGPGHAVIRQRQHGSYGTPIISASPAPRV